MPSDMVQGHEPEGRDSGSEGGSEGSTEGGSEGGSEGSTEGGSEGGSSPSSPTGAAAELERGWDDGSQQLFRSVLANLKQQEERQRHKQAQQEQAELRRLQQLQGLLELQQQEQNERRTVAWDGANETAVDPSADAERNALPVIPEAPAAEPSPQVEAEVGASLQTPERAVSRATVSPASVVDHTVAGGHDAVAGQSASEEQGSDDPEDEVERLYARLQQSVHLREGFRLYRKLCVEEHATRVRSAPTSPASPQPVGLEMKSTTPCASAPPDPEDVRKANAERFEARMRRKRAQLPCSVVCDPQQKCRCF